VVFTRSPAGSTLRRRRNGAVGYRRFVEDYPDEGAGFHQLLYARPKATQIALVQEVEFAIGLSTEPHDALVSDAGTIDPVAPVNPSAKFAPVAQPTLHPGTQALVVAALAWLTPST